MYSLQFRGRATEIAPGVMRAVTAAPSSVLVTIIGEGGVDGRIESRDGAEARFDSEDEST
jgi:hypothetical protein